MGRDPPTLQGATQLAYDSLSYAAVIQARLAELQDFVDANIAPAAANQKSSYDQHTSSSSFKQGEPVWLLVPTAGKLEPQWEGGWGFKSLKSTVNVKIFDDKRTKVVHTNRLQHRCVPGTLDTATQANQRDDGAKSDWSPPVIEHLILQPAEVSLESTALPPKTSPTTRQIPPMM